MGRRQIPQRSRVPRYEGEDLPFQLAMLEKITPVILTFNEAPNIGRTLGKLAWARDIVIVDSGSTDATLAIARECPQVRVFQRSFDTHAAQWTYAITQTGIATEWVLALDADYTLTPAVIEELSTLQPSSRISGFRAGFIYCVGGKPLRSALYPPVTVLFRHARASYRQDGHTHRVEVGGDVEQLGSSLLHDDRKPWTRWIVAQCRYMRLEAEKVRNARVPCLNWPGRIRKLRIVAPGVMILYCLFARGLILDGRAGMLYTLQRTLAEALLSFYLLKGDLSIVQRIRKRHPLEM